jgi:hypothetical protein
MSSQVLCLHMFAQHVILVGFVVIMVISQTLWTRRHRCVSESVLLPCVALQCRERA